jgi:hypothetical protein
MDSNYRALRGGQGTNILGIDIATKPGWKAYQTVQLDTLKLYTQPHGTKTGNLIVNLEDDATLLLAEGERSLASYDCRMYFVPYEGWYMQLADKQRGSGNETELSFFNMQDYLAFKANPEQKW